MSLFEIYQPSFMTDISSFMAEEDDLDMSLPPLSSPEDSLDSSSASMQQFHDSLCIGELPRDDEFHIQDFDVFGQFFESSVKNQTPESSEETKWSVGVGDEIQGWDSMTTFESSPMEFDDQINDLLNSDLMESLYEADESDQSPLSHLNQSPVDEYVQWNHDPAINAGQTSMDMTSLVLPFEGMEIDKHLSLSHLLVAYAEAMANQDIVLARAIAQRVVQKVSLTGETMERVFYYMFQHLNRQSSHLAQEIFKNFHLAFKAVYQIFPYGKVVHVLANQAIVDALRSDIEILHLIDFDIGEGVQLATLMEAIRHRNVELRITSVKSSGDDETSPLMWKFEETKRRLLDQARSCGLKLKVEEVALQDLENDLMNMKAGDNKRNSWYVFNCNVELLHMGRVQSKNEAVQFLMLAKQFLINVNKGMITHGSGEVRHDASTLSSYTSFLDRNFQHYQTLLQSMEFHFPNQLGDARTTLEGLFVAPYVSAVEWHRKWVEQKQGGNARFEAGLQGWELTEASLAEAKEMVKGRDSLYGVKLENGQKNEVVLECNGVPMVRFCCWMS